MMATIEEINERMSFLKKIENVQRDRRVLRSQRELLEREVKSLSEAVRMKKRNNEMQIEMLQAVKGIVNCEKETSAAVSACNSSLTMGFSPLLRFTESEVKKCKMLQDMKKIEVEEKIGKIIDEYSNQNPMYQALNEKRMQFHQAEIDLKNIREKTIRFQNFAAEENAVEDMLMQHEIIDLARTTLRYYKNFPESAPKPALVPQHDIPVNEEQHHIDDTTSSATTSDFVPNVINFKMLPPRYPPKRNANETLNLDDKCDLPKALKPAQKMSKKPTDSANMKSLQEPDKQTMKSTVDFESSSGTTSEQMNFEVSPNLSFDLNFDGPTPPISDFSNSGPVYNLDFGENSDFANLFK